MSRPAIRMLSLLSLLQTGRVWTGTQLAERLEVSARTVRSDIERLRGMGYDVHASRGGAGDPACAGRRTGVAHPFRGAVPQPGAVAVRLPVPREPDCASAGRHRSRGGAVPAGQPGTPLVPPRLRGRRARLAGVRRQPRTATHTHRPALHCAATTRRRGGHRDGGTRTGMATRGNGDRRGPGRTRPAGDPAGGRHRHPSRRAHLRPPDRRGVAQGDRTGTTVHPAR